MQCEAPTLPRSKENNSCALTAVNVGGPCENQAQHMSAKPRVTSTLQGATSQAACKARNRRATAKAQQLRHNTACLLYTSDAADECSV
eukprot:8230530-Alexandrium_andersonii.AAC.1